jgi:hypothetical protein
MQLLPSLLCLVLIYSCSAQVEQPGRFSTGTFSKTAVSAQAVHRLPQQDNERLAKAADEEDARTGAPFKFAQAIEYSIDMNKEGEWREDKEGGVRRWRVQVSSPGAVSLSLLFSDFHLPGEGEFYVIGKHRTHGAYTAAQNNMDDRKFAVGLVKGDTVILEYVEPLSKQKGLASIHLHKVVHGFRAGTAYGMSGKCNIDVACSDGNFWKNQINSVGMLLTNDGQRFCSGAMVNNARQDGTQYFLTANHCIFSDVSYFMVGFNYQWSYCRSGGVNGTNTEPSIQLVQGMSVVSKWDRSDFALLLVKEKIPDTYNVFMAGWDQRNTQSPNAIGIHHPSGDVKKISTYVGPLGTTSWTEFPNKYHWNIPKWTRGVTEPGSSGSPLFNTKGLVIGHLHGGQSACEFPTGYDMYGGVAWDWASSLLPSQRLGNYLNPTKINVTSVNGVYLKDARLRAKASLTGKVILK